jgi:hypothetical protein
MTYLDRIEFSHDEIQKAINLLNIINKLTQLLKKLDVI